MPEQFTDGEWAMGGEFMDGHIAVIVGDPSKPAWEWEFVATVHYEADDEARGEGGITREQAEANAHLFAAAKELFAALDPDTLDAIASEIESFEHSARAHSLRVTAQKQREAIAKARGEVRQPEVISNL